MEVLIQQLWVCHPLTIYNLSQWWMVSYIQLFFSMHVTFQSILTFMYTVHYKNYPSCRSATVTFTVGWQRTYLSTRSFADVSVVGMDYSTIFLDARKTMKNRMIVINALQNIYECVMYKFFVQIIRKVIHDSCMQKFWLNWFCNGIIILTLN